MNDSNRIVAAYGGCFLTTIILAGIGVGIGYAIHKDMPVDKYR